MGQREHHMKRHHSPTLLPIMLWMSQQNCCSPYTQAMPRHMVMPEISRGKLHRYSSISCRRYTPPCHTDTRTVRPGQRESADFRRHPQHCYTDTRTVRPGQRESADFRWHT